MSRLVEPFRGRLALLLWLTLVWTGLWGNLSAANVLGGLLVGAVLMVVLPLPAVVGDGGVRPLALLRFLAVFLLELNKASVTVVLQVLRPPGELQQAVIAVPVRGTSDRLLTLIANAVSLTPGTLTLEVDRPQSTLYVHVLNIAGGAEGVEEVRRSILQLERYMILALGSAEALAALDEPVVPSAPGLEPGAAAVDEGGR